MSCRLTTCVIGDMRRSISWRSRLSKARQDSTESTASVPSIREFELFREFCSMDVSTAACTTNLRTLRAIAAGRRDRNGNINGAVVLTASSSTLSRGVLPMVSPVVVPPSVGLLASVSCPLPLNPAPTSSPVPVTVSPLIVSDSPPTSCCVPAVVPTVSAKGARRTVGFVVRPSICAVSIVKKERVLFSTYSKSCS